VVVFLISRPFLPLCCLLLGTLAAPIVGAESVNVAGPVPPCNTSPFPTYPDEPGKINIRFWPEQSEPDNWQPPGCLQWELHDYSVLMSAAGRFISAPVNQGILHKVASVSALAGLRYWSVTRNDWAVLISDSHALTDVSSKQPREDFEPSSLREGQTLFYWQNEQTTIGGMSYQMRILELRPGRIVLSVENLEPAEFLWFTAMQKGAIQAVYFFDHLGGNQWGYYHLARVQQELQWPKVGEASYENRAAAIFGYFSGLAETDLPVRKK